MKLVYGSCMACGVCVLLMCVCVWWLYVHMGMHVRVFLCTSSSFYMRILCACMCVVMCGFLCCVRDMSRVCGCM